MKALAIETKDIKNSNQFPTFISCRNEKKSTSPEKSQSYNIVTLTQTRQYFHINSFIFIHSQGRLKLTSLFPISFISLKASLAILAAIPMNSPLAKPFTSKAFTDSKPPKLEILPPTSRGRLQPVNTKVPMLLGDSENTEKSNRHQYQSLGLEMS